MTELILILIFSIANLFSFFSGLIISYHFRRFTLVESPGTKKILTGFWSGSIFFFILSLIFLIFTI